MNAAEAGAVQLEEPDWTQRFHELVAMLDDEPLELREDDAFEQILREYRRFHFTWLSDGKRKPMEAAAALIALAGLRLFPPRSRRKYIPRDNQCYEPDRGDDHCWLTIAGRAWRIVAIESRTLFLDSFGEQRQIDLARAKWDKHSETALAALRAAYPPSSLTPAS